MPTNTSGLKRGGTVKQEEPLYLDRQRPIISEREEKEILSEIKKEWQVWGLMMPAKDYCII